MLWISVKFYEMGYIQKMWEVLSSQMFNLNLNLLCIIISETDYSVNTINTRDGYDYIIIIKIYLSQYKKVQNTWIHYIIEKNTS